MAACLYGVLTARASNAARAEAVAARNYNVEFYDRWAQLPADTLLARGHRYLDAAEKRDSALLCYSIVANRYYERRQNDKERGQSIQAMNNIGYLYFYYYYDYQQAYNWLQKSLTLARKHQVNQTKPYALLNLGNLMNLMEGYNSEGSRERAMDYYRQAWHAAVEAKDWRMAMIIANNVLSIAVEDDFQFIDTLATEIDRHPIPDSTQLLSYVRDNIGVFKCLDRNDYQGALQHCAQAEQHLDARDTPERYVIGLYGTKVEIYKQMGDNEQALYWLNKAHDLAQQEDVRDLMVDVEKEYYEYYKSIGNMQEAHRHEVLYLQKKDSLINQGKLIKANELYFLNQLQEVNTEVERVAHNNRIWRWVVAALALIILLIGTLMYFLRRKNRQLEEDRQQMYNKMQETINMEQTLQKYRRSTLDDDSKDDLADRIVQAMQQTDSICNEEFSRDTLAQMVGTSPSNISQVLSERFDKNFSQLLNEYRIKEACRRISDQEHYSQYTIEAIAASVGFKSRTNFAANFKKVTGLTPSQYLNEARKKA